MSIKKVSIIKNLFEFAIAEITGLNYVPEGV